MCHASERAEQIVRLDIVPKDASRGPTGDQRLITGRQLWRHSYGDFPDICWVFVARPSGKQASAK
jgi:hypothetical protein